MVCQVKDASEIKQISQIKGLRSMIPRHRRHVVEIGACLRLHAVPVIQQTGPFDATRQCSSERERGMHGGSRVRLTPAGTISLSAPPLEAAR